MTTNSYLTIIKDFLDRSLDRKSLLECNDIRKMLNKKYLGNVPRKVALS